VRAGGLERSTRAMARRATPHRGGVRLGGEAMEAAAVVGGTAASGRLGCDRSSGEESAGRGPEQCVGARPVGSPRDAPPTGAQTSSMRPSGRCRPGAAQLQDAVYRGRPCSAVRCPRRACGHVLVRMRRPPGVLVQAAFLAAVSTFGHAAGPSLRLGVTSDSAAMSEATRLPIMALVGGVAAEAASAFGVARISVLAAVTAALVQALEHLVERFLAEVGDARARRRALDQLADRVDCARFKQFRGARRGRGPRCAGRGPASRSRRRSRRELEAWGPPPGRRRADQGAQGVACRARAHGV